MDFASSRRGVPVVEFRSEQLGPELLIGKIAFDKGEDRGQRIGVAGLIDASAFAAFIGIQDLAVRCDVASDDG